MDGENKKQKAQEVWIKLYSTLITFKNRKII